MAKKRIMAKDIIKRINKKLGITVKSLMDETLDLTTDVMDTGSYAMNSILTGDINGGVPIGKITGFYGPSGCGKTFVIGQTIGNAQKMGYIPIVVDTESTWDERARGFGIDPENTILINDIMVIEDLRNKLSAVIKDTIAENKEAFDAGELKLLLVIDSLGGLRAAKEIKDVAEGKDAADMGTRAKAMFGLFRELTPLCGVNKIPFMWTNHCMDNPAAMHPEAIQKMPGGKSIWFFSSCIVMMRRREEKNEDNEIGTFARNKGATIPIECVKQRYVRPFLRAEMYIDYSRGIDKYSGLFDWAKDLGVIIGSRTYELADGTKLGYRKAIEKDAKLWEDTILPVLNKSINDNFGFGTKRTEEVMAELEADVEGIKLLEEEFGTDD